MSAAPDNDNFADDNQIAALPFEDNPDTTDATFEINEPSSGCDYGYPLQTVWYSYKPSEDIKLTANLYYYYGALLAIYTGETLDNLTQIDCSYSYYDPITFEAQANVTYYFQLSPRYGEEGSMHFELEVTPPSSVWLNFDPYYPNVYDNVYFYADPYDPAGIGGDSFAWMLWDGTILNEPAFNYQFQADGDYPVSLLFTTSDGRSGTTNTIVQVRTRDVAITRFSLPQTARTNQTKVITVEITNKLYPEDVEVYLYKGLPGGDYQLVGYLTMYVPSRTNRPTQFKFSYTFTAADAALGNVTFRAEANIVDGRDALPMDNTAYRTVMVK